MRHPQRQLLPEESEGGQAAMAKHQQGAEKRPGRVTEDDGAKEGRGRTQVAGEVEADNTARKKKTESYSGTSRTGIGARMERPARTVRFEDEPTVFGMDKVQQVMATDATERDNRRAAVYVATVRPTLASTRYASEAREAELRGRSGEGAAVRSAGEGAEVDRTGEGAAAPPAEGNDGVLRSTTTTSRLDDGEQRMMALTTDIAGAVELESKATLLSPTGGDTNNGADPNAAPTVSEDVTTTKPPDVTDTPGTDTRTRANAGVGGVDSRENEAATMHGDGARNDDAVVQAKQDEISQARLARH
ncbi:hypothetical protein PR001_g31753, partial [Phytophthora rubi]